MRLTSLWITWYQGIRPKLLHKGLTNDQVQLITELAQELVMPTSHGAKMSTKQQELLARIIENFVR